MQIYLIRHTRVDVPAGMCYGQSDVPLADTFEQESEKVKSELKGIKPDFIYSSPMTRCRRLAEAIADNQMIYFDDRLKEYNFGQWEMRLWDNIPMEETKSWMNDYLNIRCPGGESYMDVYTRVNEFIILLNEKHPDKTVFIFTHGGVIRTCLSVIRKVEQKESFKLFQQIEYGQVIKLV